MQRRHEDREDQRQPEDEAGDPPALRRVAANEKRVAQRERGDEDERLEVERPGVRIVHGSDATL
jgi:hypothetical protein